RTNTGTAAAAAGASGSTGRRSQSAQGMFRTLQMPAGPTREAAFSSCRPRASEGSVHVRISRTEPVAERRPEQLARGGGRRAFHDEMLAVKKIGRVLRIRRHRGEAREWRERRARPLPSVADEIFHAPRARAGRMA